MDSLDARVRLRLLEAVEALTREVVEASGRLGDCLALADALSRAMVGLAERYREIGEAWDAAGGDPELAAIFTGTGNLTPDEFSRWQAGTPLRQLRQAGGPRAGLETFDDPAAGA